MLAANQPAFINHQLVVATVEFRFGHRSCPILSKDYEQSSVSLEEFYCSSVACTVGLSGPSTAFHLVVVWRVWCIIIFDSYINRVLRNAVNCRTTWVPCGVNWRRRSWRRTGRTPWTTSTAWRRCSTLAWPRQVPCKPYSSAPGSYTGLCSSSSTTLRVSQPHQGWGSLILLVTRVISTVTVAPTNGNQVGDIRSLVSCCRSS